MQDEGEAVKIKAVKEAEASAARTEIQAKADAEAAFLSGQGVSRQSQAIMEGLRESVNAFSREVRYTYSVALYILSRSRRWRAAARVPCTHAHAVHR